MAIEWERPKDPSEIVDYAHDWSADLGSDTIESSSWQAVSAAGTSEVSSSSTDTVARIFLGGGTDGETAVWLNRITTAGGRTLEQAFTLAIVDVATVPPPPPPSPARRSTSYTNAQIEDEEARLAAYLEAEIAALRNQRYRMPDGRELQRADLAQIRAGIAECRSNLDRMTGKVRARGRARRGVLL